MRRSKEAGKGRNSKIMCYSDEFSKNYALIKANPNIDEVFQLFVNGFTIEELLKVNKFEHLYEDIKKFNMP